jgi:hypothetical protein
MLVIDAPQQQINEKNSQKWTAPHPRNCSSAGIGTNVEWAGTL